MMVLRFLGFSGRGLPLKVLENEDTLLLMMFLGLRKLVNICCGHKMFLNKIKVLTNDRGHIVADTLLLMMFLGLRKLGNICFGHEMFLNKIRNIFVSRTKNLCPQQMFLRAGKQRNNCVGNNVSATMCGYPAITNICVHDVRAICQFPPIRANVHIPYPEKCGM